MAPLSKGGGKGRGREKGFQEGCAEQRPQEAKSRSKEAKRRKVKAKKVKVEQKQKQSPAFSGVVKCPLGLCKLPLVAAVES